jgi:hypothetical protein
MRLVPRRTGLPAVALLLGALSAGFAVRPACAAEEECEGPQCPAFDPGHHAWKLGRVHRLFGGLYNTSYRTEMFALLSELKRLSAAEMVQRLEIATQVAEEEGADGLESLILGLADGIHSRRVPEASAKARDILGRTHVWYVHQVPSDDMFVPLGRASTRLVVSVRPVAARALLSSLVANPAALRTEDLLNLAATQRSLCGLPKVRSDAHLLESLADLDFHRQVDCDKGVIGKGGRNAPRVARRISANACVDVPLDSFRDSTDDYSLGDRMADLKQCLQDVDAYFRPDSVNAYGAGEPTAAKGLGGLLPQIELDLGAVAAEQIKQLGETTRAVGAAANGYGRAWWDYKLEEWKNEQKRKNELSDREIDAVVRQVSAEFEVGAAETEVRETQAEVDRAQEAAEEASAAVEDAARAKRAADNCQGCTQGDRDAAAEALDRAKQEKEKKDRELAEAKAKAEAAKQRLAAAKAAAAAAQAALDALRKAQGQKDGTNDDFHSAACNRLIANGRDFTNPAETTRLPEDWTDMKTWLDLVSHPNPDDPGPVGASSTFGLSSCGADLPTTRGASNCSSLTQCTDPTVQCSCNLDAETLEQQAIEFAERRGDFVCFATTCPDGARPKAVGQLCACDDGSDTGEEPKPRPLPVEDLFVTTGSTSLTAAGGITERTPLSKITRDVFLNR